VTQRRQMVAGLLEAARLTVWDIVGSLCLLCSGGSMLMCRHVRARSKLLGCVAVAAALFAASAGSASGTAPPGHLEVDVMNEPVRGGEPELAVNPGNPNDLVLGHTVVGNTYANTSARSGSRGREWRPLQVSHDGGKTWTADRALHTSGFSEGPDPYLIAHGQPRGDRLSP